MRQRPLAMATAATLAFALHPAPAEATCSNSFSGTSVVTVLGSTSCVAWTGGNGAINVTNAGIISGGGTGFAGSGVSPSFVLTNSGTISGTIYGALIFGTIGTVSNGGLIAGSGLYGIYNSGGTIGTLSNASGGTITGGDMGVDSTGTITAVINNGLISTSSIYALFNNGGSIATLTNGSTGIINGATLGLANSGRITSVINNGTISGNNAIENGLSGTIGTITNTGVISGTADGILNFLGVFGTVNNSGTISGPLVALNNSGTITAVINSGRIGGGATGIGNSGTIGTLTNTGTITGSANAIDYSGGSIGSIANAGVIAGNITNSTSNALNISGGSGSTFGTLTGSSGGIGSITSTSAGLNFNSGNLLLNDSINVGSHTVSNAGATLEVDNPMTITGSYTQAQAATLLVGVSSAATTAGSLSDIGYGRLVVNGNATIAAGSSVTFKGTGSGFGFAAGQRFVVVDATGTGTYNAGTLNYSISGSPLAMLTGATGTSSGHTDLVVTVDSLAPATPPGSGTSGTGTSGTGTSGTPGTGTSSTGSSPVSPQSNAFLASVPNAVSTLHGLFGYTGVSQSQLLNLYDATLAAVNDGSTATANRIGMQLSPTQTARAAAAPTFDVVGIVNAHVNALRLAHAQGGSGIATGEGTPRWTAWGQAFGGHASQDARDNVDGYSANYGGLLLGADRSLSGNWRAGGVFEYAHTAINNTDNTAGDSTGVNAYGLLGYASYAGNHWYVDFSGGVVLQYYDTTRLVNMTGFSGVANGSFSGQQYVASAEAGYPLALGGMTLTPLASLSYSYLNQNSFTETGGNGAALSVDGEHVSSVRSAIGAKLSKAFSTSYGVLAPELKVQWIHEYDHSAQTTSARFAADPTGETSFTTVGQAPVSNLADVTLGVTLARANNLSLSARYELQAGSGFMSNSGMLRLQQLF